jgi:hypothetical protein
MFKNIGIVLKKNSSLEERSVVQGLINVLAKNLLNIFAEEGTDLFLVSEPDRSFDSLWWRRDFAGSSQKIYCRRNSLAWD